MAKKKTKKRASKRKKPTLKTRAKKAGRKAKKAAGTDVGRAGIGAGVGALALGPVGAAAGAYVGLKHIGKGRKKSKKNPDIAVKVSSAMGVAMLDYHKVSANVEHVAASALRGMKVDLDVIKAARKDLRKAAKHQTAAEREQMSDLAESLGKIVDRYSAKPERESLPNPARAFSLETEVGRGRQRRARGAASRSTRARSAAGAAAEASKKKRLAAALNPGGKKRKHNVQVTNPLQSGRGKGGKFESRYTPTQEDIVLLKRAGMLKHVEGLPPKQIDKILKALRKEQARVIDSDLKRKIATFKRRMYEHEVVMRRSRPLAGDVAKAKRRMDSANEALIAAAELRGIEPVELTRIIAAQPMPNPRKGNPGVISTQPGAELYEAEIPSLGTLELLPRGVQIWTDEYVKQRRQRVSKATAKKLGWSAVKRAGYYEGATGWTRPKRRFNPSWKIVHWGDKEKPGRPIRVGENDVILIDPTEKYWLLASRHASIRLIDPKWTVKGRKSSIPFDGMKISALSIASRKKLPERLEMRARSAVKWAEATGIQELEAEARRISNPSKSTNKKSKKATRKASPRKGMPKLPPTGTLPVEAINDILAPTFFSAFEGYMKRGADGKKVTKKQAEALAAATAWEETNRYWYKRGTKWYKRKSPLAQVASPHHITNPGAAQVSAGVESILIIAPKAGAKTVADTEIYRVFLSKIREKGIKPTPKNILEYMADKYPERVGVFVAHWDPRLPPVAMAVRNEPHGPLRFRNPKKVKLHETFGTLGKPFQKRKGKSVSGWVIKKYEPYEAAATLAKENMAISVKEDVRTGRWMFSLYERELGLVGQKLHTEAKQTVRSFDTAIDSAVKWASGQAAAEAAVQNPARAFELETEIGKGRQKRAKGAAGRATRARSAAGAAASASLRKRLAKINPSRYFEEIPQMSDADLQREHAAVQDLIVKAYGHPETVGMTKDLRDIRTAIVAEEKRRGIANPGKKAKKKASKKKVKKKASKKKASKKTMKKAGPKSKKLFRDYCKKRSDFKAALKSQSDEDAVMKRLQATASALSKLVTQLKKTDEGRGTREEIALAIDVNCDVAAEIERVRIEQGISKAESRKITREVMEELERESAAPNPKKGWTKHPAHIQDSFRLAEKIFGGPPDAIRAEGWVYYPDGTKKRVGAKKKAAKKKAAKKATRKKSSPSGRLIRRCQKLWDHYCERPGKKRLKAVLEHLETMKASTSKKVKSERSKCLRAANAEAKRLGIK